MHGASPRRRRTAAPKLDAAEVQPAAHRSTAPADDTAGAALWLPLGLCILAAVSAFTSAGLTLHPRLLARLPGYAAAIGAALGLQYMGRLRWLTRYTLYNNYLALLGMAGMIAAYAAGTLGRSFADSTLLSLDRALGYDWRAYAGFYESHALAAALILPAYTLAYLLPTATITLLVATGRAARVERYLVAMLVATFLTVILFALFPARTAWGAGAVPLEEVRAFKYLPLQSEGWEYDLLRLRGGKLITIDGGSGIVAFPSLHCATALLCGWAVLPLRWMRWPLLAICAATLLATPVVGGHYLADMVGGAAVAAAGIMAAKPVHRLLARRVRFVGSQGFEAAGECPNPG